MISEIIKNHNMNNDLESYWFQIRLEGIARNGRGFKAASIQGVWDGVAGILNGVLELYQTNDQNSRSLVASFNVNSPSNKDNSILEELSGSFGFLKIKYISNGISGGSLSVYVNYTELI